MADARARRAQDAAGVDTLEFNLFTPTSGAKQDQSSQATVAVDPVTGAPDTTLASVLTRALLLASEDKLEAVRALLDGTLDADVTDRAGRLLGHVVVDSMPTVAVTVGEVEIKNDEGDPVPVSSTTLAKEAGGHLEALDAKDFATQTTLAAVLAQSLLLASEAKLEAVRAILAGTLTVSGTVTATGPLTDAQLRATDVDVVVTGSALPTDAATATNQATEITRLASIDGKIPASPATTGKQDSIIAGIGAVTDAEASGDGSVIGVTKRIRTLIGAGFDIALSVVRDAVNAVAARLPAAFTAGGGVKTGLVDALPAGTNTVGKVDQGAAGVAPWLVTGTVATGGLTDAQLRATPPPISGTVAVSTVGGSVAVTNAALTSIDGKIPASPATAGAQDTSNAALGAPVDAEASGDGTIIGLLKRLRTLLGGTITVSNADMAAAAASLGVLDDWDESNRVAVNIIAGQAGVQGGSGAVNALTQRVALATDVPLPAGTNSIGTVVADPTVATVVRYGQKLIAITNTAISIAAASAVRGLVVQALSANGASVWVGGSGVTTGNGFELQAGQAAGLEIDDVAKVFVNGTAGDGVCFIGGGN